MFTPKQQKFVDLLIENYGAKGNTKSLGALMIEAGYSESSAINPKLILTEEMKEAINPILNKMESIRTNALDEITNEKLEKASPRDAMYIVDTMTKNIQLLNGKETERTGVTINVVSYGNNDST